MNKNAIKKFATEARRELISRVSQRAMKYGISDKEIGNPNDDSVGGHLLSSTEKKQRAALIDRIKEKGYEQVMEEVAYTWFNRFSALRFMEVNGYLPTGVRVFTDENNSFKPQILTESIYLEMDGLDMEKVYAYKEANDDDELYKYLLITQCNALNSVLPGMFQRLSDYTELLFPDNLLREGSVVHQMIELIDEEDWKDAVQIIGWMFQYYNTELKSKADLDVKNGKKITGKNLPEKTQIFTPDWIVRYMVENSLGRLWAEGHPNDELKSQWKYYLEEAEQEVEVQAQLATIREEYKVLKPEDILCIDPCSGSGHILAYMFDVLMQIYESYGYTTREAVASIVENNIYGLDIDDRAAQLAYFSVMMKACQYDKRFLSRRVQPHVYAIVESNHVDRYAVEYFCNGDAKLKEAMDTIIEELHDAKEYGSIITVSQQDWDALYARFDEIQAESVLSIYTDTSLELKKLIDVAKALSQKYAVAVTNPPYLGMRGIGDKILNYIQKNYSDSKNDFFAVFIDRLMQMANKFGYVSLVTAESWLSLSSFEAIRLKVLRNTTVNNMLHLGKNAFDAGFGTVAFLLKNSFVKKYIGSYYRLVDLDTSEEKEMAVVNGDDELYYSAKQDDFFNIPGAAVSYWVSEELFSTFEKYTPLGEIAEPRQGLTTCDNNRFMRFWYEVRFSNICFSCQIPGDSESKFEKWFPYNKGGEPRRWYGNNDYVVNWQFNGKEVKEFVAKKYVSYTRTVKNIPYYFKKGLTWSAIAKRYAVRAYDSGFIFADKGQALFADDSLYYYLCGLLNSKFADAILQIISPTLDFNCGYIKKIPIKIDSSDKKAAVEHIVKINIEISKSDWDSFETSWDFKRHPLLQYAEVTLQMIAKEESNGYLILNGIADAYRHWEQACDKRFNQLKANEEELNRIFIDIYGLQDELTPEVEDKDVTVRKADLERDIKSFISYAVGCMFGRYSLDVDGLAYAGGEFSDQWVVISGQYYKREAVEYYVGKELSRAFGMAESYAGGGRNLSAGEAASKRGVVCIIGSDEEGGSGDSFKYRRGTSKKLYEGIRTISVNSERVSSGTGNTIYDLCSPEILAAISNGSGNELATRGWKDAEWVDWQAIHCSLTTNHYYPDKDNIIPICDDEYFEDDIIGRFVKFVEVVYGKGTLEENLKFIADGLGGKGQPKDVIRKYFLNGFYKDHCKMYKKRPIYWMFDSGKKNGFKCLIYMHRYQPDTLARIRTDYVHEQQARYRTAIDDLDNRMANASTGERVKLNKQLKTLNDQATEIHEYEEKIHHLADRMISIDLDDGVKKNYAIFQDVLAKIK